MHEAARHASDEETPYDVFVSYARRDNASGWLSALVQQLAALEPPAGSGPLRIFFDIEEISSMDLWRQRLEGALRRSRVLLVCLSPNWRDSITCRWEWAAFHAARAGRRAGTPSGLGIVHVVEVKPDDLGKPADFTEAVLTKIHDTQTLLDLRPGSPAATAGLANANGWPQPPGQAEAQRIAKALWAHVGREREAARGQGNLRGGNPHFVGRRRELGELHRALALGRAGVISAVQGLGGIGKTELALQYAYEHAWHYTAGMWQVGAEGHAQLLPLLALLAQDSNFLTLHGARGEPLSFTPQERADAHALGRAVLHAMLRRAQRLRDDERHRLAEAGYTREPRGGGAVLVILDNVDQAALLAQRDLVTLPELNEAQERIRFLATSRIGRDQLTADAVQVVPLDRLSPDEARALMLTHRGGQPYPDDAYAAAVERLVVLLDGFTLTVEQVAVYLALNPSVHAEVLLQAFEAEGLTKTDSLVAADPRIHGEMLHRERLFDIVLGQMLKSLDALPLARATLDHAAWLAPDHVPWTWLEKLAREAQPEGFVHDAWQPDPWQQAQARLGATQLLSDVAPGVARMHRLVGDHLRRRAASFGETGAQIRVESFAGTTAFALEREYHGAPTQWQSEHTALRELAQHWALSKRADPRAGIVAGIVASIELEEGSFARAGTLSEFALACHEAVAAKADQNAVNALAASLQRRAQFLDRRGQDGDAKRALGFYERSLEISETLLAANPGSAQVARNLCGTLQRLADYLTKRGQGGDAERAQGYYERSLQGSEALCAANPASAQAAREVTVSLNKLARFLAERGQSGDAERALGLYERSLKVSEALNSANPSSAQATGDVSFSLSGLAYFLTRRGIGVDAERALGLYERSLVIRETLLAANPGSAQAARDVFVSLVGLANFLAQRGQGGDAERGLGLYERSLEISETLLAASPGSAQAARDVFVSLVGLANFLAQRGQGGDAERGLGLYERSLEISETLLAANPGSAQAARDVVRSLAGLANFLAQRGQGGDAERALGFFERGLEVSETVQAANPGFAQAARDVFVSLSNLAIFLARRGQGGDSERASCCFERALEITKSLLAANPGSAQAGRDESVGLNNLTGFLAQRGQGGDVKRAGFLRAQLGGPGVAADR